MKSKYTTVDRIIYMVKRQVSDSIPTDTIIDLIGDAIDFTNTKASLQEAVAFIEVSEHICDLPKDLVYVIQVSKNNSLTVNSEFREKNKCNDIIENIEDESKPINNCNYAITDCDGNIIDDDNIAYYRPAWSMIYNYNNYISSNHYKNNYTPMRLATGSFFSNINCSLADNYNKTCGHEYSIKGSLDNLKLQTSFKEGYISVAYLKRETDEKGYPLIEDNISLINAIIYYIKWKVAESYRWEGRQGFEREAKEAYELWNKYISQYNNSGMMPSTIDEYENLKTQSIYLIPKDNYRSYFNNLSKGNIGRHF